MDDIGEVKGERVKEEETRREIEPFDQKMDGPVDDNVCSIKVVCRFRPLNDSEERAGSKFVAKFPQGTEECCNLGVRFDCNIYIYIYVQT